MGGDGGRGVTMESTARQTALATKLLSHFVSTAMVLSLVPTPALAEAIQDDQGQQAITTVDEGQGAQGTDSPSGPAASPESAGGDNGDETDAGDKMSTTDTSEEGLGGSTTQGDGTQASEADDASTRALGAAPNRDASASVTYIERSWDSDAEKVISETKPAEGAIPVPSDGKMTSGWYYLDRNVTVSSRIFLEGDTHLILCDGCELDVKGIYVPKGSTFSVYAQSDGNHAGKIDSHPSGGGAGIGATRDNHPGGNVVIHGGNIESKGDDHCAGIGGNDGNETDVGDFTMYGGTVTATGGSYSAGIGGGQACEGGRITIYDGTVTATGKKYAAGIGGGNGLGHEPFRGGHAGTITIWGGTITAEGGEDGAGIGGGEGGNAGTITINGGTITAEGGDCAAGIGCGEGETTGAGGYIFINGGTVTATGGDYAAGIGGGCNTNENYDDSHGYCDDIVISGGDIIANGGCRAAAIGAGAYSDGIRIDISGGKIRANGDSDNGIGIGSAHNSWGSTNIYFTYTDATRDTIEITASKYYGNLNCWTRFVCPHTGNSYGGVIPKGVLPDGKTLVAYRSTSTTYRDLDGNKKSVEGIPVRDDTYTWWGGNNVFIVDRDVRIDHQVELDADVTLILNDGCTLNVFNIRVEKGYTLTIYGQDKGTGTVITSPDNYNRAGIGGAYTDCGTITINGGTIRATGGSNPSSGSGSAGIGAAYGQPAGTVNINGGTVVATGGAGAQGIGSSNKDKGKTTLSYTDYTCDKTSVTASSYDGTVKLAKPFMDKADHTVFSATDSADNLDDLAGRKLVPIPTRPIFRSAALILSGSIGVEFLMELPELDGVDYTDSYMEFVVSGKGGGRTIEEYDPSHKASDGAYYVFTRTINAVQMADTITATFHYTKDGEEKTVSHEYSAAQYVADFDAKGGFDDKTTGLVHAVADYGHYLQPFLSATNGWTIGTDYAEIPASTTYTDEMVAEAAAVAAGYATSVTLPASGEFASVSASLNALSDTSLELRAYMADGAKVSSASIENGDGKQATLRKKSSTCWLISVPGIKAYELNDTYDFTITSSSGSEATLSISGLAYANAVLTSKAYREDQAARRAMTALVRYCQAGEAYKNRSKRA